MKSLTESFDEVKIMIRSGAPSIDAMSADGLMMVIEKMMTGEKIKDDDFAAIQVFYLIKFRCMLHSNDNYFFFYNDLYTKA